MTKLLQRGSGYNMTNVICSMQRVVCDLEFRKNNGVVERSEDDSIVQKIYLRLLYGFAHAVSRIFYECVALQYL
jgi:hypothetical protein